MEMRGLLSRLFAPSLAYDGEVRDIRDLHFESVADKVAFLRAAIQRGAEDPRVREVTVEVIRNYGARPRDFRAQVEAVQLYIRDHFYYVWENKETFQSAPYTLTHKFGDCDDFTICSGAMLEGIGIPTRIEILGTKKGDGPTTWKHVYLRAGLPPKNPTSWLPVECTLPQADLDFEPAEFLRRVQGDAGI